MREGERRQRGERARVARRVRALLDQHRSGRAGTGAVGPDTAPVLEAGPPPGTGLAREAGPVPGAGPPPGAEVVPEVLPVLPALPGPVRGEPDVGWPAVSLESPRHGAGNPVSRLTSRAAARLREHGVRLDPGHRGGLAMGLAALIAALVAGWWVLSSRPHAVAMSSSPGPSPAGSSSAGSAPSSAGAARLVVDVVGKVRRPGVYRIADGARVDDALRMAGGALPGVDLSSLNLARKVVDGEQIAVGVAGAPAAGGPVAGAPVGGGPGAPGAAPGTPVNLNTATVQQLDTLPGIGPVLAQRILDWRTEHGRFASVDQLREVTGIGPSRFDDLRPLVTA